MTLAPLYAVPAARVLAACFLFPVDFAPALLLAVPGAVVEPGVEHVRRVVPRLPVFFAPVEAAASVVARLCCRALIQQRARNLGFASSIVGRRNRLSLTLTRICRGPAIIPQVQLWF